MSLFGWRGNQSTARKSPRWVRPQLEVLEDRTVPAVFTVAASDVATLVADIAQANSNGQSNTINLTASTYDLTAVNNNTYGPNGLPAITSNLTINGNGAILVRDSSLGGNTPFRLFYVSGSQAANSTAGNLTLENVTLEGGLAQGGNSGTGGGGLGAGGAIFNQGTLALNGVTVTQNTAMGGSSGTGTGGGGGGIGQDGQGDNGGGLGGAGSTTGVGGVGGVGGGGGDSTANVALGASAAGGAGGFGGGGGGGTFLGGAGGFGGGGGTSGGSGAGGAGGFGAGKGSNNGGGGGAGLGGAIFNLNGTTTLVNSTLAANLAQGGSGGPNGTNGDGYGGAIFNLNGTVNITSSTLASNSIAGNASGAGAVYNLALGSTSTGQPVQAIVNLTDSILANSVIGNDLINDQSNSTTNSAVVNATTPNIVMAMNTINGATTNGTPNTANPFLGLLANNGGPTPTMALLGGSPAIGVGVTGVNVPTTDQRGGQRGSLIDLGAFQQTTSLTAGTTTTLTAGTAVPGQPVTLTATVVGTTAGATPAGSVLFVDTTTGTTLGTSDLAVVNGQLQATLSPTLSLGTHVISATYQSANGLATSTANTSLIVGSSNQIWLEQIYQALLGRDVDPSGLAFWNAALAGGASRGAVVYYITQSMEYHANQIQSAFQTLLGRAATSNDLNYFLGLMGQGQSIEQIDSIIVGSGEYFQGHGGGTNDGFLAALYQDFLHRAIDSTSLQVAEQALASGQTLTQIALGVMGTTEYKTDLVQNAYQTYLHRSADTGSLNAFVSYLLAGGSDTVVTATLLGSAEYLSDITA